MSTIWRIDNAYYAGDPFALSTLADEISSVPGFQGLGAIIRTDATNISTRLVKG